MDIFDFALKMEKDGEAFYRRLAEQTESGGIKTVLLMLADEEAKHFQIIEEMKAQHPMMSESTILDDARNIFVQMRETPEIFDLSAAQIEVYRRALSIEDQSRKFYEEKAGEVGNDEQKQLLLNLVQEEDKHYHLIEDILDFVSHPATWLENAEFFHSDDY